MGPSRSFLTIAFLCISLVLASCQNEVTTPSSPSSPAGDVNGLQKVAKRDISDFLSTQVSVITGLDPNDPDQKLFVSDCAGYLNDNYLLGLPSTFDGSIMEKPLPDGRAEVKISIRAHNVLTYVLSVLTGPPYPVLFGASRSMVEGGATATLGEAKLEITFINSAPGAPIPDIYAMDISRITFNASAFGPLTAAAGLGPDGTRGHAWTNQVGLLTKVHGHPSIDGFATEYVRLQAVGR
jgi:hypothetical protein